MMSLRERNRHQAMRLTQRTALDLFAEKGFDAVTVEEIAEHVGMAASTIYRHFTTKETIVLWEEFDAVIDDALVRELSSKPPLAALRDVFVQELGTRYDEDLDFQLRRVQYIYATEQLHTAAVERDHRDTRELSAALTHFLSPENRDAAVIIAGTAMLALDTALDRWQDSDAGEALGDLIADAFATLAQLGSLQ